MSSRKWLAIAIVAPIFFMTLWVMKLEKNARRGIEVELPIEGYDPRDLLSGHYLTYRIQFGALNPCVEQSGYSRSDEKCVCLKKQEKSVLWIADKIEFCGEEKTDTSCKTFLRGSCKNGRFIAGIERFYFSETMTRQLAVVPTGASIVVRINSAGEAIVKDLKIDGMPYRDKLK